MELKMRYGIVIQRDELDVDGTKELLTRYGEVYNVEDHELEDGTPVTIFFIESNFGGYTRCKLELNCIEAEDTKYILFPMASREDKNEVLRQRGIIPGKE